MSLLLGRRVFLVTAGRNGDGHVLNVNAFDMPGDTEYAQDAQVEGEAFDADERRSIGATVIAQGKAIAGDLHAWSGLDAETSQLDLAVKAVTEFTNDPFPSVLVNVASTEINEEKKSGKEAYWDSDEIRPGAKGARGFRHQWCLKEEMLWGGEKFRMDRTRVGGVIDDGEGGVDIKSDRREANFLVARLIAQLQRDVLGPEGCVREGRDTQAKNDFVLVNIERRFGEGESVQLAFGVGNLAGFEPGRSVGAKTSGDQIVSGSLVSVDMEAITDFQDDSDLEGRSTGDRLDRNICGRRHHLTPRGDLGSGRRQCDQDD